MNLTKEECQALLPQLDMVLQGMSEAWEAMVEDRYTFETVEEFAEVMGQAEADIENIKSVKRKVEHELRRQCRPRSIRSLLPRLQGDAG
jgi:hypothetical protein